jgi:hypothetical protein
MVVAASYLFWVQRRLFLGPVDEPANRGLIDLDRMERGLILVLAIPLLWIGIYPNPVLRRVEPAVLEVLYHMDRRLERIEIPDAEGDTEMVRVDASSDVKSLFARVVGLRLTDPDRGTESFGEEDP